MKKIFFALFFIFCTGAFALESQLDVLAGGFYNYNKICKGSASYQKIINYDYYDYDGDYRAAFKGFGGSLGFDWFINSFPFGLYFRAGLMSISGVERTAGGEVVTLKNNVANLNMYYDLGGVYAFNINDFVSVCAAPAVSIIFINSEYRNINYMYSSRATVDSLFGVGATADMYFKCRYKYFVAAAGCTASFYPVTMVTSQDSAIDYSSNIRGTMAYNIRPYISIGFTIKD